MVSGHDFPLDKVEEKLGWDNIWELQALLANKFVWVSKDFGSIMVSNMETDHIENAIQWITSSIRSRITEVLGKHLRIPHEGMIESGEHNAIRFMVRWCQKPASIPILESLKEELGRRAAVNTHHCPLCGYGHLVKRT